MEIFKTIIELRNALKNARKAEKTIGLVPTMGALHQGHISLIEASLKKCHLTVATIFVNPAQFNNLGDLSNYPKTIEADIEKLADCGCDILFLPDEKEIYPSNPSLKILLEKIGGELEGKFRPGHFNGVGLVVSKFFNIIQPDQAFFGQKDIQQFFIIKSIIDQLNFPITINMVPTVREPNGLAMSSRNMRLTEDEQNDASLIYRALRKAQENLLQGKMIHVVKTQIEELFNDSERLSLEYFEIVSVDDFHSVEVLEENKKMALCIAAEIGQVRLIDNLMLIS